MTDLSNGQKRLEASLNTYHKEFLAHLIGHRVRFLIIGGQALSIHEDNDTQDLDIWVMHQEDNLKVFEKAFVEWRERYPLHTSIQVNHFWKEIRPSIQIHLPDADVGILASENQILRLNSQNKIDILFGIDGLSFEDCSEDAIVTAYGQAMSKRAWKLSQCIRP